MPYVRLLLSRNVPSRDDSDFQSKLYVRLRQIIADALAVPESAKFPFHEVTIDGDFMTLGDAPRHMEADVEIVVFSNYYPEREAIKDQIAQQILDAVKEFLPSNLTAWVWVLLQNGGFAKT